MSVPLAFIFITLFSLISGSSIQSNEASYQTIYFNMKLDHFNYADQRTFKQKILLNLDSWKQSECGPIFFYTGNEGKIELFANNTGFMFEIAPSFNAMLVFAEHRYYGSTLPFGENTYSNNANLVYLTAEQALADFASDITQIRQMYGCPNAKVVAFGGSYGGMLSTWFRIKFPQLVSGAIAASAPIWQFTGVSPSTTYTNITTRTFANSKNGAACVAGYTSVWDIITNYTATPQGRGALSKLFGFCSDLTPFSQANATQLVFNWVSGALQNLPMGDYPYFSTFLGPLPGNPIDVVCSFFPSAPVTNDPLTILGAVRNGMNVFYNYSGTSGSCFDIAVTEPSTLTADSTGWNYQSCTQMVMPIGQYGPPSDMFFLAPWNLTSIISNCQSQFGVTPDPNWITQYFGGHDLATSGVTNIFFTNGNLDPWSGGGVLFNISDTVVSYVIEGGAHHLDLRFSDPLDPPSVRFVRQKQKEAISFWLNGSSSSSSSFPVKWVAVICIVGTALFMVLLYYFIQWYNGSGKETEDQSAPVVSTKAKAPTQSASSSYSPIATYEPPVVSSDNAINGRL